MLTHVACAFLAALSSTADPPADKGPAELQGGWRLESLTVGGMEADLHGNQPPWVVRGTKVLYAGDEIASLSAEPKAAPPGIDLTLLDSKKTYEGIYSVDKDTWKIVLNADSEGVKGTAAADFSPGDKENLRVLTFRAATKAAPARRRTKVRAFADLRACGSTRTQRKWSCRPRWRKSRRREGGAEKGRRRRQGRRHGRDGSPYDGKRRAAAEGGRRSGVPRPPRRQGKGT